MSSAVRCLTRRAALVLSALLAASCGTAQDVRPTAEVGSLFEPAPLWPGLTWSGDGQPVSTDELSTAAGPEHCGWNNAVFLLLRDSGGNIREFVRDPRAAVGLWSEGFAKGVDPPADAERTVYRHDDLELRIAADGRFAYLVRGRVAERWPRVEPLQLCD